MIHKKLLSLLVLLMTVASGAWADIAVGNVFKTGSTIDFGTSSVRYKQFSGSSDNSSMGISGMVTLTYEEYSDGKHKFRFPTGSGAQFMYIVSDNNAEPWGIRVSGGEGTMGNPYSFEVLFEEQVSLSINNNKDEATFAMPAFDATVDYEIVRDMAVSMTTKVGDGEDGAEYRIRLKKNEQGDGYVPAEMDVQQVIALFKVHDGIENKDLTFYGAEAVCALSIYAADDNDQPTGDAISFANLEPGRYVAVATAADGSAYDGSTAASNVLVLFEGYPVKVAAGEFITYYKDENLRLDTEETDAKIYTITGITMNGTEARAQLTPLSVAAANTPLLVKNNSNATKTILLIPTATDGDEVEVFPGFVGTLEATTIPGEAGDGIEFFALNGKKFVWVVDDITVAPNKAWLQFPVYSASIRTVTFDIEDEATEIEEVDIEQLAVDIDDSWYDLQGRKLDGQPTTKGVYIKNGKKVVVK